MPIYLRCIYDPDSDTTISTRTVRIAGCEILALIAAICLFMPTSGLGRRDPEQQWGDDFAIVRCFARLLIYIYLSQKHHLCPLTVSRYHTNYKAGK